MKTTVAVIYGGRSGEHEISIRSAKSIMAALDRDRYDVVDYFIDPAGKWSPEPILPEPGAHPEIDVVFPVLHGTFGEDGTVQGLLELADLPYVGAAVLASAVSMDKEMMKRICIERGLPVVEYVALARHALNAEAIETVAKRFPFPVFVKPANLGSSVGISKVHSRAELEPAMRLAAEFDGKIVVERAIEGRELECAVPSKEFYDYEDKYLLDRAQFRLPAELSAQQTADLRRLAVECYRAVGCEGMARVDFLLESATGTLYLNEINTIPGFTSISMYPKMWEQSGLSFSALVDRLIELALERHAARKATRFTR